MSDSVTTRIIEASDQISMLTPRKRIALIRYLVGAFGMAFLDTLFRWLEVWNDLEDEAFDVR